MQVIQTLSAGVNMVTPYVQPHMTLCNASGSHDVAVAEWQGSVTLCQFS